MRSLRMAVAVLPTIPLLVAFAPGAFAGGTSAFPGCLSQPGGELGNYRSDIDGDGKPDLVVGLAGYGRTGAVDVKGSLSGDRVYPGSAFPSLHASARFGAAVAQADVNNDGCDDLVIGDPGYPGGGAVDIVFGTPTGLSPARTLQVTARTAQDDYGAAVSVGHYWAGDPDNGYGLPQTDLWVGAPGRTVDGKAEAGAIDHYGLFPGQAPIYKDSVDEDHLPSQSAHNALAGGRFGTILTAGEGYDYDGVYWGRLFAGAPNDTVNGQPQAGRVYVIDDQANVAVGDVPPVVGWYSFVEGDHAPGGPEPGDHFGASLATLSPYGQLLAIGAPGEDLGPSRNAGCVLLYEVNEQGVYVAFASMLTQEAAGVPGVSETGDRFGAALDFPSTSPHSADKSLLVGVPGEDLGRVVDAGDADLLTVRETTNPITEAPLHVVAGSALTQGGHGTLGGAIEAGDQVGATVSHLYPAAASTLLIGVPGEDLGNITDAGVVGLYQPSSTALRSYTTSGGAVAHLLYGRRLTQQVNGYR